MKQRLNLPLLNVLRRPGRSSALVILSLLLSFFLLAGGLIITGLQSGLQSMEARLGADIMVVPYEASTKSQLSDIILQGNPGYFYMSQDKADSVLSREGIGQASTQFFLASSASSCCSYKVQLIGFDPETDFTITPWIDQSGMHSDTLGLMEVYVGSDLNAFAGDELTFFGSTVTVAGRLDRTGTYLDTAVYGTNETMKQLITAAMELQVYDFGDIDPDSVVSSILINVADGYTVEDVLNDINIHVRGVSAVRTQTMISDVSTKLSGVADIAGILIGVVWILILGIMIVIFSMIANERKKEFAIYRVLGTSRSSLSGIIFKETLWISLTGAVIGAVLAILLSFLFTGLMENSLGLPYLLPGTGSMVIFACVSTLVTIISACLSASICAAKISKVDAALILRGEN